VGFFGERLVTQEHGQVDDVQKRQVSRNLMLYNHFSKLYVKPVRTSERTQPVSIIKASGVMLFREVMYCLL
jgi:hypothetical protein